MLLALILYLVLLTAVLYRRPSHTHGVHHSRRG